MDRLTTTLLGAALCCAATTPAWAQPRQTNDWPSYNRTLQGDRFAPQIAVTPATAGRLKPICSYDLGRQTSFQTGPLEIGGLIYVTTDFDTIALDAATCAVKWKTTEAYQAASPLNVNRGAAIGGARLFRGTQDGRLLAYDLATGKRLWAQALADPALGETIPAAPIAWNGMVFVGNAGGDNKGVKGRMYALDAATGKILWEQYLVPRQAGDKARGPAAPAPAMPPGGWGNAPGVPITGGGTWTSYALDPASGVLYAPGGNPAPDFAPQLRPGTNPYAGSLVALDARTGALKTAFPIVERDFHDWDVSAAPAIVTTRGGVRLAAEAIKNGHVYGLDIASGKQLWSTPTTTILNATAPLTATGTRFCPGTQGGSEWNGAAYSPATNLLYVGAVDWCDTVKLAPPAQVNAVQPGKPWSGSADAKNAFGKLDPPGHWSGWVNAVDADSGKLAWKRKLPAPVLGGVTPTAGGVVFVGDMAGGLYALDAKTGATVWTAKPGGAVGGGIISYSTAGGDQRVAVAAGMTSPIWPTAKVNARLVVYGLK